jgi:cobalamin-dependent methionine synthase I
MTAPTLLSLATPCVLSPIATNTNYGPAFLEGIEQICASFNGVHLMRDLSNISFGLPERKFLNQTVMVIAKGLDHAIINPLDKKMMPNSIAA